jgi:hypothetical protein
MLMFVTLISVILGLISIAPGIGIPAGILLFIAWARTVSTIRHRPPAASPLTFPQKIAAYFSSLGFVIAILLLVLVAIAVAFGAVCYGLFTVADALQKNSISVVGAVGIVIVGVLFAMGLLHLANRWNDEQFSRAAGRDQKPSNDSEHP